MLAATAAQALAEVSVLPDSTTRDVARAASSGPRAARLRAVELLSRAAPSTRPSVARTLGAAAESPDTLVQAVALHNLVTLLPQLDATERSGLLPVVSRATHVAASDVRWSALEAYATYADLALDADSVWAVTGPAPAAPSADVRAAAAAALGAFAGATVATSPRAASAVAALVRSLDDAEPDVRRESARALGAFGRVALPAAAALRARGADANPGVQVAVHEALARLGVAAP